MRNRKRDDQTTPIESNRYAILLGTQSRVPETRYRQMGAREAQPW